MNIVLEEGAYEPVRGHADDAGLDLRCPVRTVIPAGGAAVIDLLVRAEIPRGYFGKLESKSGLNVKHGVASLGGTIDSGFTGTIVAKLYNFGPEDYVLEAGDKCVQLIIMPCETPELVKVDSLHDTERGSNGFGSTGR